MPPRSLSNANTDIAWKKEEMEGGRRGSEMRTASSEKILLSCEKVLPVCAWLVFRKTGLLSAQACRVSERLWSGEKSERKRVEEGKKDRVGFNFGLRDAIVVVRVVRVRLERRNRGRWRARQLR